MKQIIILLVAFTMLVKPLWPVAEYVMNYDYIKNVLCENKDRPQLNCDGKCYLAKQLAAAAEQNEENPFGEKQSKTEIQHITFFQSLPQMAFESKIYEVKHDNYKTVRKLVSDLLTSDIAQPPELA